MLDRIIVAKVEWADHYQGETLAETFRDGDQYERYNFRPGADGRFYGVIPGRTPRDRTECWTVLFVARHPTQRVLAAIGWYKDARFVDKQVRPEYSYDSSVPMSSKYRTHLKYTVATREAYLIRSRDRLKYPLPNVGNHFGNTTFVYARGPEVPAESWRTRLASFTDDLVAHLPYSSVVP